MAKAVPGHLRHRAAWYHEMSGPFVCPDSKITELSAALTAAMIAELDLALALPAGAGGLDQAVDSVFADPRLRLRAAELPVSPADDDPVGAVEVGADALDRAPLAGGAGLIEVPVALVTEDVARAAASRRYPIKVRTGG